MSDEDGSMTEAEVFASVRQYAVAEDCRHSLAVYAGWGKYKCTECDRLVDSRRPGG